MGGIKAIERYIYEVRKKHPLIIPQLDPDKCNTTQAKVWLDKVAKTDIQIICVGGSMVDSLSMQEIIDTILNDYDFKIITYLTSNVSALRGCGGRTAMYWGQIPNSPNTAFGWDGLIANSIYLDKREWEPLPAVYVFDDRAYIGTANWISRSYPIPKEKPEISLATAKAAQYMGMRFYIMAGGSGSPNPPPVEHIEKLRKLSDMFVIATSGIRTVNQIKGVFAAGADAIHIGGILEKNFKEDILSDMLDTAKLYPGRRFYE